MTAVRCTHTVTVEIDVEVDATHRCGDAAEVTGLRIAGVELWPLIRDRMEFAEVRRQIGNELGEWEAERLAEEIEAETITA